MKNARRPLLALAVLAALAAVAAPFARSASPCPASLSDQKTIVIDPGHGGLDVGAKGKFGNLEKTVTLAISQKLKTLIEQNMAYRVLLTRDKDIDISLENRSALANNNDAVLFISIHANGSFRPATGAETFYMSLTDRDEETRKLAYLENNSSQLEKRIADEAKDDVTMILWDMAQAAYIKQSARLAEAIQGELPALLTMEGRPSRSLAVENRGIKQARFKVLTGVACPAVLVEVAFISNPEEEQKLINEAFQTSVAQAIYRGLVSYMKSIGPPPLPPSPPPSPSPSP
jgi:N-acetylmuramoyl-L-alanine amidase